MKNRKAFLFQPAVIAGLYVLLTFIFEDFSFHEIQVRVSEALTIMTLFTFAAGPGLFAGCLISNILHSAPLIDILLGSFVTLAAAFLTSRVSKSRPWLGPVPPIVANALVVPIILRHGYGAATPYIQMMLTVGLGELISCGVLGLLLYYILAKSNKRKKS